jgi:hypothetical protein
MTHRLTVIPDSIQLLDLRQLETAHLDLAPRTERLEARSVAEMTSIRETGLVKTLEPFT